MTTLLIGVGILFAISAAAALLLFRRLGRMQREHGALSSAHAAMRQRFSGIIDAEAEREKIRRETEAERARTLQNAEAERMRIQTDAQQIRAESDRIVADMQQQQTVWTAEIQSLRERIAVLQAEFQALDEEANLQSFGFYKPRYEFADSEQYQSRLDEVRRQQKQMISAKTAAVCHTEWIVSGSRAEGRKQVNQTLKLIVRAFNGECDAAIAKVRYNNFGVMETRIRKAWEAINALVQVQTCEIARGYLALKLDELSLVYEYQEKLQEEKEEQRRIREQMREEEIALREMEKARQDAEKEEKRYADALRKAQEDAEKTVGEKHDAMMNQIAELQRRLAEAQANKERAIARAQMTRSGHVYVISNIGSFGEHVYKIGMTRRLDPMDRIRELSDASVPFQFDVHAVIFSEDAPALENALHRLFTHRRVNMVNERKEFFHAPIEEIATAVRQHHGEIEVTLLADAREYRETVAMRAERERLSPPPPAGGTVPAQIAIPENFFIGGAATPAA